MSEEPKKETSAFEDSGDRKIWGTGAQRDRQYGKGTPSLVPDWVLWTVRSVDWVSLMVSRIYEDGSIKYDRNNWLKGMPLSQFIDSAQRHLAKLKAGRRNEPHASMALWNCIGYIAMAYLIKIGARPAELNDMTDITKPNPNDPAEPLSEYEYKNLSTFLGLEYDGSKEKASENRVCSGETKA